MISYAYLEAFVLKNTLDGCILSVRSQLGLKDHSERAISHDLALGILHFSGLASHAVLYFLTDDLYIIIVCTISLCSNVVISMAYSYLPCASW